MTKIILFQKMSSNQKYFAVITVSKSKEFENLKKIFLKCDSPIITPQDRKNPN